MKGYENNYIEQKDLDGKKTISFDYFPKTNHTSIWIQNTKNQIYKVNVSLSLWAKLSHLYGGLVEQAVNIVGMCPTIHTIFLARVIAVYIRLEFKKEEQPT